MAAPLILKSIVDKLKLVFHVQTNKVQSPRVTIKQTNFIFFNKGDVKISSNEALKKELTKLAPVISTAVDQQSASIKAIGGLQIIKSTNNPTKEELDLVQQARGNKPYNIINNVRITHDEQGNITLLQWDES